MTAPQKEYRMIPLSQGQFAKVDADDCERISKRPWSAHWNPLTKTYYAHGCEKINGKWVSSVMHREIMGVPYGDPREVDHQSMDTLDNRKSNLRIAPNGENKMNRRVRSDSGTGVKGVHKRANGRYRVCIRAYGKRMTVGHYGTLKAAKAAYEAAAKIHHGEFARTK